MPKRTGLGQRGLDLLISAAPGGKETDSSKEVSAEEKKNSRSKKAASGKKASKSSTGKSGKAGEDSETVKSAGKAKSTGASKRASASKSTAASKGASASKSAAASKSAVKDTAGKKGSAGSKGSAGTKKLSADAKSTKESKTAAKEPQTAETAVRAHSSGEPVMVPISMVEPNREQPRRNFDEDALQELAESIRQYGIIQPLIVQERDGYYEIIAGERRWRAARIASLKEVPVIIREYTSREVMEISLIENIQREDLNPIEEAGAYRRLMEEFSLKQDEVALRVSKSRAAIANSVRLLNLDQRVQDMIVAQMLSTGHARALLAITDPEQQYLTAQKVFDEKLTVRDVEKLVRKMNEAPAVSVKKPVSDALQAIYANLAEQMKSALGTKVIISPKSAQKGKIEIEYYSSDELDRLCTLLNHIEAREGV